MLHESYYLLLLDTTQKTVELHNWDYFYGIKLAKQCSQRISEKNSNINFRPASFEANKGLILSTNLVNRNLVD